MNNEQISNDDFLEYLRHVKNMMRGKLDEHNDIVNDAVIHSYYVGGYDVICAVMSNYISYLQGKEDNENE